MSTFPLFRSVAVWLERAVVMLPVAVHVPGVWASAVVADIPVTKGFPNESVTDLLNPTTATRTAIEQRTKPIKTRGLKKADREADFFFIAITSSCASEPCRFADFPAERG